MENDAAVKHKPVPIYATREEWLVALVESLRPMFQEAGYEIPAVRISCSWPSASIRKRLGECWHSKAAKDGSRHVFITPRIEEPLAVADVVIHELLHAALPDGTGHRGPFRQGMKKLGLGGKPTSTNMGAELTARVNVLLESLGEYPHSALRLKDMVTKKQGTRMLKLECPGCGYVIRTTAKWIETGVPVCAACKQGFEPCS
jgi:hypothetical protein